jgi:SEC-C motif-containing protein
MTSIFFDEDHDILSTAETQRKTPEFIVPAVQRIKTQHSGVELFLSRTGYNKNMNIKNKKENNATLCPCESGKTYKLCCQPYVEQSSNAPTAEALMRSRYSAFALLHEDHLRYSWHPDTCPQTIHLNINTKWLGLKIINTVAGGENDDTGEVEFIARSKINGKASRLHENSHFKRFENRWVYLDGKTTD